MMTPVVSGKSIPSSAELTKAGSAGEGKQQSSFFAALDQSLNEAIAALAHSSGGGAKQGDSGQPHSSSPSEKTPSQGPSLLPSFTEKKPHVPSAKTPALKAVPAGKQSPPSQGVSQLAPQKSSTSSSQIEESLEPPTPPAASPVSQPQSQPETKAQSASSSGGSTPLSDAAVKPIRIQGGRYETAKSGAPGNPVEPAQDSHEAKNTEKTEKTEPETRKDTKAKKTEEGRTAASPLASGLSLVSPHGLSAQPSPHAKLVVPVSLPSEKTASVRVSSAGPSPVAAVHSVKTVQQPQATGAHDASLEPVSDKEGAGHSTGPQDGPALNPRESLAASDPVKDKAGAKDTSPVPAEAPAPSHAEPGSILQLASSEVSSAKQHASTTTETASAAASSIDRVSTTLRADSSHELLHSGPDRLEVGVATDTHGWLKIRAELAGDGTVNTSIVGASNTTADRLRNDLPALSSYLAAEHVAVGTLSVHAAAQPSLTQHHSSNQGNASSSYQGNASGSGDRSGSRQQQQNLPEAVVAEPSVLHDNGTIEDFQAIPQPVVSRGGRWLNVQA